MWGAFQKDFGASGLGTSVPRDLASRQPPRPHALYYDLPMAYIRTVDPAHATGLLKRLYDAAVARAGKVFHVIRAQSPRPKVLRASTQLYLEVMYGESGLSRAERELIATVVSRANDCHY